MWIRQLSFFWLKIIRYSYNHSCLVDIRRLWNRLMIVWDLALVSSSHRCKLCWVDWMWISSRSIWLNEWFSARILWARDFFVHFSWYIFLEADWRWRLLSIIWIAWWVRRLIHRHLLRMIVVVDSCLIISRYVR